MLISIINRSVCFKQTKMETVKSLFLIYFFIFTHPSFSRADSQRNDDKESIFNDFLQSEVTPFPVEVNMNSKNLKNPTEVNQTQTMYDIVDESEYVSNYWDCSTQDEKLKRKNLIEIDEMLSKGEQQLRKVQVNASDVVLVLGNAGVGKTTLVQFMAGDTSKLISKEVGNDTGEYLIEDGIKIGSSVTESQTIFPELVTSESDGVTFCDTPGFSDTRSPNHAILATYLMKSYLKNFKTIKIILMVPYSSVQLGMDKDGFINLLRNFNSFISGNIDGYKDSILLIVTKVTNNYIARHNNVTLIPDENIVNSIAEFISQIEKSVEKKIKKISDKEEKQFLMNILKLSTKLRETDDQGKYKKISLFRRPSIPGPLTDIPLLQINKETLKSSINNSIYYTKLYENDVGYTLSDQAKNHIDCLLNYINDKIINVSKGIFNDFIRKSYENKMKTYDDIYKISSELKTLEIELVILKCKLYDSKTIANYTNLIHDFISKENITNPQENVFEHYENELIEISGYLNKIQQFNDIKYLLNADEWASKIEPLNTFIKDSSLWYDVLIKIYRYLSSYEIQKSVAKYMNETGFNGIYYNSTNDEKVSFYKFLLSNSKYLPDKEVNSYFNKAHLNNEQIKELEEIISVTLTESITIECLAGKLTISGNFAKTSEVSKRESVIKYCGNDNLLVLVIKARNTVFIDDDIDDELYKGINIIIIAPNWEIIGSRRIKIDGKDGKMLPDPIPETEDNLHPDDINRDNLDPDNINRDILDPDNDFNRTPVPFIHHPKLPMHYKNEVKTNINGSDGLPGLPGENGGDFFGIGMNFLNGISLKISSNGGKGGSGQNGQNGKEGSKGKDGFTLIKQMILGKKFPECKSITLNSGASDIDTALQNTVINLNFESNKPNSRSVFDFVSETTSPHPLFNYMDVYECKTKTEIYICKGSEGEIGGCGGNGGVGGYGGNAGKIQVIGLERSSQIRSENKTGSIGTAGSKGIGGESGESGKTIMCIDVTIEYRNYSRREFWRCLVNSTSSKYQKGTDGLSNYTKTGILKPTKRMGEFNYSSEVLGYVLDLQKFKNNKLLSEITSKFQGELVKKWFEVNYNELWKIIIKQDKVL